MKKELSRRKLIQNGIAAGLLLPFMGSSLLSCVNSKENQSTGSNKSLKILILGGTSFLGPHQIAYAISRGHKITTFTRGKTKPLVHHELFRQVESLIGDREDDLSALGNGNWDVVIDNSGMKTAWTKRTANLLKDRANLYLYTSSTGVYFPYYTSNVNEKTQVVLEMPKDVKDEETKMEFAYGIMKATSEIAAKKAFGMDRTMIVRPTYMFGPSDKTNRFIHWPIRLARGGEVLVPGKKEDPVQYIDVRDVAEWMIRLAEEKITGTFNAVGPKDAQTMQEFVAEASTAFNKDYTFINVDDWEFLKKNDVLWLVPWLMPEGNIFGSARVNNAKAIANGLTFRPLPKSIKETHDWWYSKYVSQKRRDAFEKKKDEVIMRESEIIAKWKSYSK